MQETREIPHVPFTEDMKKDYTILVPNMLPVQLKLMYDAGMSATYTAMGMFLPCGPCS